MGNIGKIVSNSVIVSTYTAKITINVDHIAINIVSFMGDFPVVDGNSVVVTHNIDNISSNSVDSMANAIKITINNGKVSGDFYLVSTCYCAVSYKRVDALTACTDVTSTINIVRGDQFKKLTWRVERCWGCINIQREGNKNKDSGCGV